MNRNAIFLCFLYLFGLLIFSNGNDYFESRYEISSEDLIQNYIKPRKALVVKNSSKKMPIFKYVNNPDEINNNLKEIQVNRSFSATGVLFSTEEVGLNDFIVKEKNGAAFQLEVSKQYKLIYDAILVPSAITLCKPLKQRFKENATLSMHGFKTKQTNRFGAVCATENKFVAVLLGKATYRLTSGSRVQLSDGDFIFIPTGTCYSMSSVGTYVTIEMDWKQVNDQSVDCDSKSIYSIRKHLPVNQEEINYVLKDNEILDKILNTGLTMPPIGLGTSRLFDKTYDTVKIALELGYRLIDTAHVYSGENKITDFTLSSEMEIGRALQDSEIHRSEIFLVSKLNPDIDSKQDTVLSVEKSLQDLKTEYIDLMLIHDFDAEECGIEVSGGIPECEGIVWESWRILEEYQNKGVLKSIGASNIRLSDLKVLLKFAKNKVSVIQNWFDPFHQDVEIRNLCKENGIIYMGYSTLGYSWIDEVFGQGYETNPAFTNPIIIERATTRDLPITSFLLRWAMENDVVVMPCTSNVKHLEMNLLSKKQYVGDAILPIKELDNILGNPDNDEDWEKRDFPWKVRDEL